MIYFSDVDMVLKLARCGFLPWLPELLGVEKQAIKVQHLASLKSRVKKLTKEAQRKDLEAFCKAHSIISGTADIARQQALLDGGMDPGEALLFAEAETTGGIVVTGDKRALAAYARLSTPAQRAKIKVVCWEQLLLRVHHLKGYDELKRGACEATAEDGLLSLAFSSGLATQEEHALAAIESYLNGVKSHSADLLFSFDPDL
jgi:hypothetical protein